MILKSCDAAAPAARRREVHTRPSGGRHPKTTVGVRRCAWRRGQINLTRTENVLPEINILHPAPMWRSFRAPPLGRRQSATKKAIERTKRLRCDIRGDIRTYSG